MTTPEYMQTFLFFLFLFLKEKEKKNKNKANVKGDCSLPAQQQEHYSHPLLQHPPKTHPAKTKLLLHSVLTQTGYLGNSYWIYQQRLSVANFTLDWALMSHCCYSTNQLGDSTKSKGEEAQPQPVCKQRLKLKGYVRFFYTAGQDIKHHQLFFCIW